MKKLLLIFLFMAMSCDGSKKSSDVEVRTNKTEFFRESDIVVTIENTSDHTIAISACENQSDIYYDREKLTANGWEYWTQLNCLTTLVPLEIGPGASITDTINVAKAGTYRFRFPYIHDQDSSTLTMVYSNEFSTYQ